MAGGAASGACARDALRTGLELKRGIGENPYRFGFIGSTDGHGGASTAEERQYIGKLGRIVGTNKGRDSVPRGPEDSDGASVLIEWSALGLAGVWPEHNTRQSIYAALRKKETFATSGPQIKLRFLAGYQSTPEIIEGTDLIKRACSCGVSKGVNLAVEPRKRPQFLVWAVREPTAGWLQRAQIAKGWVDYKKSREQVYDVACSDSLVPDRGTHRCPNSRAEVHLAACHASRDKGAMEVSPVDRSRF